MGIAPSELSFPDGDPDGAVVGPLVLPSSRKRRRLRLPGWLRLLLTNPKSCTGLVLFTGIVVAALAAPLLAQNSPTDIVGLPGQPPNKDFWFGTTDQGYDVFAQVVWGARTSLTVAAIAAVVSMVIATTLGLLAAYSGGWIDDTINLVTNVFLVIPTLPLLIVISAFVPTRGPVIMVLILSLTTWAIEARILRGQALSLRNRDFVLAAKVAGEGTRGIIWREMMPNMVSRIAAGFVFVFYGSIIFAAGLEFLGFGDVNKTSWGVTLYWAQNNSSVLQGAWWHFVFPGLAIAVTVAALVFVNYGVDELSNPRLRRPRRRRRTLLRLFGGRAALRAEEAR
jgi:peptide/nickel transport system permease protein